MPIKNKYGQYAYDSTPIKVMSAVVTMMSRTINMVENASFVHIPFHSIFYEWILPLFQVVNLK